MFLSVYLFFIRLKGKPHILQDLKKIHYLVKLCTLRNIYKLEINGETKNIASSKVSAVAFKKQGLLNTRL